MGNPWIAHVKTVSKANKGKSFKEILKMAKKTYKRSPGIQKKVHKKKHMKTRRKTHKKKHMKTRRKTHKKRTTGVMKHKKKHTKTKRKSRKNL
jgi:hypothetical protein|uniref:Uncharacterized protein n=1 Tax=viral metagenome TaxID=1070528 RepID=A0A6C0C686_9ZZZZ